MGTEHETVRLYDAAMTLSRDAFAARHYGVAFHALAAALHAAADLGEDDHLLEVEAECMEQGTWLNDHDADHELSARSAVQRGSRSLWAVLREDAQRRRQFLDLYRRSQQVRAPVGARFGAR